MTTELLTDPGHTRGDLRMIRTAIRRGYDIPDALLEALPKVAGSIMLDKSQKTAARLKAIETLMAMKESNDKLNPPQPVQQVEHHHTHELSPVTVNNLAEAKRQLAARIAGQR